MTLNQIVEDYTATQLINPEIIEDLENNKNLRTFIVIHFRTHKNRLFACALLQKITEMRKPNGSDVSGNTIMLGCYILGMHNDVKDCIAIWNAKNVDFDAYCYVDIQLALFAGINKTIEYLDTVTTDDAVRALKYIKQCKAAGDLDAIDSYFNPQNMPWFV